MSEEKAFVLSYAPCRDGGQEMKFEVLTQTELVEWNVPLVFTVVWGCMMSTLDPEL